MRQTTVTELHTALSEAIVAGRGGEPVKIMHVANGMTTAEDIVYAGASEPYDGAVFWIVVAEDA